MMDLQTLIKSGVQFGHQTWRWNPKMAPYIWGQRNGVHLIDVSKTAFQLDRAVKFLESVISSGKPILWCGTKKAAQQAMMKVIKGTRCSVVKHRWVGGTLTNYSQVKKSVTKLLYLEDIIAKSDHARHTKKELSVFQKQLDRLHENVGGIRKLTWPVGALIVIDVRKEHVAISEAKTMGVPVVAIVDTNCDPSGIDYVIPANDDAPRSIECIVEYLVQAIAKVQKIAAPVKEPVVEVVLEPTISIDEVLEKALGTVEEDEVSTSDAKAKQRIAPRKLGRKSDLPKGRKE